MSEMGRPDKLVEIAAHGGLCAEISLDGAELSRLADADGTDLLWHGDPAFWAGRAPILFPIVGALAGGRYLHHGTEHELPRHGFARRSGFDLVTRTHNQATFRLVASERTLPAYPFDFLLDVTFTIVGRRIEIVTEVTNEGATPMPFSLGFHPALRWPIEPGALREGHWLVFAEEEGATVARLDADGLLAREEASPAVGRRLALTDSLFADDAMLLPGLKSRSVIYGGPSGRRIEVSFPAMPDLGIWSKPGAPFVCIEPWQGHADPAGFAGDILVKPGILILPPEASWQGGMAIEVFDAET